MSASFRGRIFGVQFTLSGAASLLPLLGAGGFADLFGVNKAIIVVAPSCFDRRRNHAEGWRWCSGALNQASAPPG